VAVLAFASMSPDTGDEYLAEGISEAIMHGLARVPGLRVIARTSAFALKGQALDVREIGARLKVRRIVEGSVRRAGQRLRVTAKLIDAETAHEVWSERFDRTLDDVFALEDDLAGAVAAQLRTLLMAEEGERLPTRQPQVAPTTSVAAYEQYLKGRFWWGQRTKAALERSVEHLQDALRIDSRFALAYAALAESYATMGLYGMAAPHEVAPTAREAANRALAIDPHAAGALCARACMRAFFEWDWEAAEQDFMAAMIADPQYPTAYQWYASTVLVPLGRFAEAQHMLSKAHDLDPLDLPQRQVFEGEAAGVRRRHPHAVDQHQRLIVSQRTQSSYADLRLCARNAVELRHRHTRQCTLQCNRCVIHRTLHEFVTGDHRHRTCEIDLLLAAVSHHHHLVHLNIHGCQHRGNVNISGQLTIHLISHTGKLQRIRCIGINRERAVRRRYNRDTCLKIGNRYGLDGPAIRSLHIT
jgi:TolB-like protein/Tfp pilus assembly protein PilF